MAQIDLAGRLAECAKTHQVPGVAVGVYADGVERYAFHGVTSVENPLAVDETTIFQFGSTGKTYTATAIMRLVEQGRVELAAPVRRYVPELRLRDEEVAAKVTVLQLFNHTAGWAGDHLRDTGAGDDALARFVTTMADLEQVSPLGESVSYNNAAVSLAGRVIEKVTGQTFEKAMVELLFEPIGLADTYFFANDIMTRRFVVGHSQEPDGTIKVSRPWEMPRSVNPAGGMASTIGDQIKWARFHLSGGLAAGGTRVLAPDLVRSMRVPTALCPGSAIGDAIGISWLLRDVDGVRIVEHGGSTLGQYAALATVPERDFAVAVMTNCGPNGPKLNREMVTWALRAYLGVSAAEPARLEVDAEALEEYVGSYETVSATATVVAAAGGLVLTTASKPEIVAEIGEEPAPPVSVELSLLARGQDQYLVTSGPARGMRGFFTRGANGRITGIHVQGRHAERAE